MFGALPNFKLLGAGLLVLFAGAIVGYYTGYGDGKEAIRVQALEATIEQLEERGIINDEIRDLDRDALLRELCPECVSDGSTD